MSYKIVVAAAALAALLGTARAQLPPPLPLGPLPIDPLTASSVANGVQQNGGLSGIVNQFTGGVLNNGNNNQGLGGLLNNGNNNQGNNNNLPNAGSAGFHIDQNSGAVFNNSGLRIGTIDQNGNFIQNVQNTGTNFNNNVNTQGQPQDGIGIQLLDRLGSLGLPNLGPNNGNNNGNVNNGANTNGVNNNLNNILPIANDGNLIDPRTILNPNGANTNTGFNTGVVGPNTNVNNGQPQVEPFNLGASIANGITNGIGGFIPANGNNGVNTNTNAPFNNAGLPNLNNVLLQPTNVNNNNGINNGLLQPNFNTNGLRTFNVQQFAPTIAPLPGNFGPVNTGIGGVGGVGGSPFGGSPLPIVNGAPLTQPGFTGGIGGVAPINQNSIITTTNALPVVGSTGFVANTPGIIPSTGVGVGGVGQDPLSTIAQGPQAVLNSLAAGPQVAGLPNPAQGPQELLNTVASGPQAVLNSVTSTLPPLPAGVGLPAGIGLPTTAPVRTFNVQQLPGLPPVAPLGAGLPGAGPLGVGLPGAGPLGVGLPGASPLGVGLPGASPLGVGLPGASPLGVGLPGASPLGVGLPGAGPGGLVGAVASGPTGLLNSVASTLPGGAPGAINLPGIGPIRTFNVQQFAPAPPAPLPGVAPVAPLGAGLPDPFLATGLPNPVGVIGGVTGPAAPGAIGGLPNPLGVGAPGLAPAPGLANPLANPVAAIQTLPATLATGPAGVLNTAVGALPGVGPGIALGAPGPGGIPPVASFGVLSLPQ